MPNALHCIGKVDQKQLFSKSFLGDCNVSIFERLFFSNMFIGYLLCTKQCQALSLKSQMKG